MPSNYLKPTRMGSIPQDNHITTDQNAIDTVLLARFAGALQGCKVHGDLFVIIKEYAPIIFQGLEGAVYIKNPSSAEFDVTVAWGDHLPGAESFSGDLCLAARNRMQQLFDPSQPGVGCQYTHPGEWRFMLCTPLLFQEEIIGALQLRGAPGENLPDSQSIEHIRNLSIIFSSHLSAMAANLKLNATLEKERLYDSTGLFNSGYIGDLLGVEMHRAARFKRPISVMMIGVNINRSLLSNPEQATVESILITTAHFLRAQVRREDPLFRYNEQQFIFVLPEAEIPDAFNRAEVLRMGTKNIRILDRNTYIKPVTISIGISGYPTHGSDIEEILQAARLALEEAEISGGDRVCHAK